MMKFNDLDKKLRVYETAHDFCVPPNIYMIARLDGRGFTKLTKERYPFKKPFDERFNEMMIKTTQHLMNCGFQVIYGYTESDEISLLFDLNTNVFSRKLRKYNSVLAGEASATFSLMLGESAVFDCRISQLPRKKDVIDYFRWRHEDAHRNALNAHCYWFLRNEGHDYKTVTAMLEGKTTAFKNELLFNNGINFNDLPAWQKRGVGIMWDWEERAGFNPVKQQLETSKRRCLKTDKNLPLSNAYSEYITALLLANEVIV